MAEIAIGVLSRQCLDRRVPDNRSCAGRRRRGRLSANKQKYEGTGASPTQMSVLNCSLFTHCYNPVTTLMRR